MRQNLTWQDCEERGMKGKVRIFAMDMSEPGN